MKEIEEYAKENSPLNMLEHPNALKITERQHEKIIVLNELIATYQVVKMTEE